MLDHKLMRLGKKNVRHDMRTLQLKKYLTPDLPPAPPKYSWSVLVESWPMLLNNGLGDCTAAGIGHMRQLWTKAVGKTPYIPTDADTLAFYEDSCGYNPTDPTTDQGGDELTVLNYAKKVGFAGEKISSYVSIDPANWDHLKLAIWLFGGVYTGIELPRTAQNQAVWDVVSADPDNNQPGSWGGHCVPLFDFDESDLVTCVTWGTTQRLTKRFWLEYGSEAYAIVSPDFLDATSQVDPAGLDLATLEHDLLQIAA